MSRGSRSVLISSRSDTSTCVKFETKYASVLVAIDCYSQYIVEALAVRPSIYFGRRAS